MSTVTCELCPNGCVLEDFETGLCRTRVNRKGELVSLVYGKPCAVHIDPIEKKPFFHFMPGSKAFSIATAGCVLTCKFCQNWEISQARPEDVDHTDLPPQSVVQAARANACPTICYTYTEPTVFYEYMYDTSVLARAAGIRNTMHSCGYINPAPLKELLTVMDAADIDLKAFSEDFYGRICGGRLKPVLDTLVAIREAGVWLEVTNLVIPTLNDKPEDMKAMCKWIVDNLGPDTPVHFSRFFPLHKLTNLPPTPPETLARARITALEAGLRYAYVGNIRGIAEYSACPRCGRTVIARDGYAVLENHVDARSGTCEFCKAKIAGVWK